MSIKNHNTDYTFYPPGPTERIPLVYSYPLTLEYCLGLRQENNLIINDGYTTLEDDQLTTEKRARFLYNTCGLTRDELESINSDGDAISDMCISHTGPYGWKGMEQYSSTDPNRASVFIAESTLIFNQILLYQQEEDDFDAAQLVYPYKPIVDPLSQSILWYFKPDSNSEWQLLSQGDDGINIIKELALTLPRCGISNITGGRFGVQMVSKYAYHLEQYLPPNYLRQSLVYMPRLAKDYPQNNTGFMDDDGTFVEGEQLWMTDYMASSITPFFVLCPLQLSLKQDLEIQMLVDETQNGNVRYGVSVYLETGFNYDSYIDSASATLPPFGPYTAWLLRADLPIGATQANVPALTIDSADAILSGGVAYNSTSYAVVRGSQNQALVRFNFPVVNPDQYYAIVTDSAVPYANTNFLRTSRLGDFRLIDVQDYGIYNYTFLDIFAPTLYTSPGYDPNIDLVEKAWLSVDKDKAYGDYFFSIESRISPIIIFSRTTPGGSKEEVTLSDAQMVGSPDNPGSYFSSVYNTTIFRRTYRARLLPGLWNVDIHPRLPNGHSEALRQPSIMIPSVSAPIEIHINITSDTTGSKDFSDISADGCNLNPDQTIPDGSLTLYINGPTKYETFVIENAEDYPPYRKLSIKNKYKVNYLASDNKGISFRSLSMAGQIVKDITYIQYLPECLLRIGITDSLNNVPNLVTIVSDFNVLYVGSPIWYHENNPRGSVVVQIPEYVPPEPPSPDPPDGEGCETNVNPGFPGWPGLTNPKVPCGPLNPGDLEGTATVQIVVVPQDVHYTMQKKNDTRAPIILSGNKIFSRVSAGEYTITGDPLELFSRQLVNDTQTFTITKDEKKTVYLRFEKCLSTRIPYLS